VIKSEPYNLEGKKAVAAKPVTPSKTQTVAGTNQNIDQNQESAQDKALADTKKNNLLPTVIVLSIVIGCVAIVSVSRKVG
jgi:hypothetical protein